MRHRVWLIVVMALALLAAGWAQAYTGMDRNDYPGDGLLGALRQSFSFTGYWLNAPSGEKTTTWAGKRAVLRDKGFGFLLLWNGRSDKQLKGKDATELGERDAAAAVTAAAREGFPAGALLFLDQEEGGRLLPEQLNYLLSWVAAVRRAGWKAGVYCSGIGADDGQGGLITTALDIERKAGSWKIPLWVARDECPPSPGCLVQKHPAVPSSALGLPDVVAWQYAMSPQRPLYTGGCPKNYAPDGVCYAPGVYHGPFGSVDMDTAASADPSGGR